MKKHYLFITVGVASSILGFLAGFLVFADDAPVKEPALTAQAEEKTVKGELENMYSPVVKLAEAEKISAGAKMVYEYFYKEDGVIETSEETPARFMVGMTREELQNNLNDWEIIKFTSSEIVLRQNIDGKSSQYYIVGEYDGYVAVFYEQDSDVPLLKEVTRTPLSALPESERERLKAGIRIFGKNALIKIMEDFSG